MVKLSGIIIAKNEEEMIADCIESLSFCDEVIVIDSGSSDRTAALAERMKAKVYQINNSDFAAIRDFGMKKAKGNWILYVDADERVSKELEVSIKNQVLSINKNAKAAYRIQRKNFYFGDHEWPQIEKLERLFKKSNLKGWHGALHETPDVAGEIGELDGFMLHYTHRDLQSMLEKTIVWSEVEAKLRYQTNHPPVVWWRFPRVMLTAFYDSFIKQKGYKAGTVGLIESMFQAFSMFATYARLWELQQNRG